MPDQSRGQTPARQNGGRQAMVVAHLMEKAAVQDGEEFAGLIRKVATDRDRQAYARLYSYFAPRVNAFLRRSGLAPGAAEEVAQETMLSVWRKASYFDGARAGASTWIFTIARNQRIDHLRRMRVMSTAESDVPVDEDDAPSGEDLFLTAEREAVVRAALAALSEDQASVLRLSYYSEKPQSEIAQELGLPLGTVKSRVRLALKRLRTLLESPS